MGICIIGIVLFVAIGLMAIMLWLRKGFNDGSIVCGLICAMILIGFAIALSTGLSDHFGTRARLEAFYETNTQNYAYAVGESRNILSQAKFAGGLEAVGEGLAYQGQSTAVTQAIVDWRDSVNAYNLELANYKAWQSNLMTNWFYFDTDAELLLIQ